MMSKDFNLIGNWHIYEMELWDEAYFNEEEQAYILIEEDGSGEFHFCCVHCQMDGEFTSSGKLEFSFEGNDECEETSGRGWVKLGNNDTIKGYIKFHHGDGSKFIARRAD